MIYTSLSYIPNLQFSQFKDISTISATHISKMGEHYNSNFQGLSNFDYSPALTGKGKATLMNRCKKRLIRKAQKLNMKAIINVRYTFSEALTGDTRVAIGTLIAYGVAIR